MVLGGQTLTVPHWWTDGSSLGGQNPEGERRELIPKTREVILLILFF